MEAGKLSGQMLREVFQGHSQTGARSAGIINGVIPLGGALWIDPESHAHAVFSAYRKEFFQLGRRIEDHMVANPGDLLKFSRFKGRGEHMGLQAKGLSHLLIAQPRLIKAAGRGTVQIVCDPRVFIKTGECLLGQQDPAFRAVPYACQNFQILLQLLFIDHIARSRKLMYVHGHTSVILKRAAESHAFSGPPFLLYGLGIFVHYPRKSPLI